MIDTRSLKDLPALQADSKRRARGVVMASSLTLALALTAGATDARITKIQITSKESPTFAGTSFGAVGQYEKIIGKAFGAVDPADPKNAVITDLALAPRN